MFDLCFLATLRLVLRSEMRQPVAWLRITSQSSKSRYEARVVASCSNWTAPLSLFPTGPAPVARWFGNYTTAAPPPRDGPSRPALSAAAGGGEGGAGRGGGSTTRLVTKPLNHRHRAGGDNACYCNALRSSVQSNWRCPPNCECINFDL